MFVVSSWILAVQEPKLGLINLVLSPSFSQETGPNMASFFTVLHLGTICILNPSIFMQGSLVSTGSAGPMIEHQK